MADPLAYRLSNGIELSWSDKREWKHVVLPSNGLRVMLISDPDADSSGAALAVSVGQSSDPEEIPGMAHFLEHMLFLGTEKWPGENEYSAYLNEHGGGSNAYTAAELTNYHFEIAPEHLRGALERFAAFFWCPLFTQSATDRELQAVDAEHAKNVQSDMWRGFQLDKSTSNPQHPYSKFGTGDSRTLRDVPAAAGIDVRAALLAFHATHYVAPRMTAVLYGREPLSTLAQWATDAFSPIPVSKPGSLSVASVHPGHPYEGATAVRQWCVPVKDSRTLQIAWGLPSLRAHYGSHPDGYLSHLIGHEGPGSILSHLKAKGWATGLTGGTFDSERGYATFCVSVSLTAEGLATAVDDIIGVVYAYIGLLRSAGPQEWVWKEEAATAAASYRFKNASRAFETVTKVASDMHEFDNAAHTSSGGYLFREFDGPAISALLSKLTPALSRVRITARDVAARCTLAERWYGTPYGTEPLEGGLMASWEAAAGDGAAARALQPALALPAPNEFIATDFELRFPPAVAAAVAPTVSGALADVAADGAVNGHSSTATAAMGDGVAADGPVGPSSRSAPREPIPVQLRSDARSAVWWHGDAHFEVPKLVLHAEIELPSGYASVRAVVLLDLALRLLKESLNELAYNASIAELAWSATATVRGIALSVGGFSHKLGVLTGKIAERLAVLTFSDELFEIQRDKAAREMRNFALSQPYHLAAYEGTLHCVTPRWHNDEKLEVLEGGGVTPASLRAFLGSGPGCLFSQAYVRALISGNATREEALSVADALIGPLSSVCAPCNPSQRSKGTRVVELTPPMDVPTSITTSSSGTTSDSVRLSWAYVCSQPARNPHDPNAAMDMLLQMGPHALGGGPATAHNALVDLAVHCLSEPYFDTLRTQQALGYIVAAAVKSEAGVDNVRFVAQSNKVTASELVARTEAFLLSWASPSGGLGALTEDKFAANVEAVIARKMEGDKSVKEEADRLWGEIRDGSLDWRRASSDIAALRKLKLSDLRAWVDRFVAPGGAGRRVFISLVEGGAGTGSSGSAAAAPEAAPADQEETEGAGDDEDGAPEEAAALPPAAAESKDDAPAASVLVDSVVQVAPPSGHGVVREDVLAPVVSAAASTAKATAPAGEASSAAAMGPASIPLSLDQAVLVQHELALLQRCVAPVDVSALIGAVEHILTADAVAKLRAALRSGGASLTVNLSPRSYFALRDALPLYRDVGAMRAMAAAAGNATTAAVQK